MEGPSKNWRLIYVTDLFSWFYHKGNEPCSFLCSTFFLEKSFVLNEFLDLNKWELWCVLFCITRAHLSRTPWWIDCLIVPPFYKFKGEYCSSFIAYSSVWSSLPSGSQPLIGVSCSFFACDSCIFHVLASATSLKSHLSYHTRRVLCVLYFRDWLTRYLHWKCKIDCENDWKLRPNTISSPIIMNRIFSIL